MLPCQLTKARGALHDTVDLLNSRNVDLEQLETVMTENNATADRYDIS